MKQIIRALSMILACLAIIGMINADLQQSNAATQVQISNVRITNLGPRKVSISWLTDGPANSIVHYGTDINDLSNINHDDRGEDYQGLTHHVTISGLTHETAFHFSVESSGVVDNNDGTFYQFTTAPIGSIPVLDTIYGQIFEEDGSTPVANTLVYLRVIDNDGTGNGQSSWLSGLTDDTGYWQDATDGPIQLSAARTESSASPFTYSLNGDLLEIEAHRAIGCTKTIQVDTAADAPAESILLTCSEDTPTPTHTVTNTVTNTPTDIPTETPTPTDTETPTPTDTETATPTPTPTDTVTATSTETTIPTSTPTDTVVATSTETTTPTPTDTVTATSTETAIPTSTPTDTVVATSTEATTLTPTPTDIVIATSTETAIPTSTPTDTVVATSTETTTPTPTDTVTATSTETATPIPTPTDTVIAISTETTISTPIPTDTVIATSAETAIPTPIDAVTSTPTSAPTDIAATPVPADTSIPVGGTDASTNTPMPTDTSVPPTNTPTPTAQSTGSSEEFIYLPIVER